MNKKHLQGHLDMITQIGNTVGMLNETVEETKEALLKAMSHSEEYCSETERTAKQLETKLKGLADSIAGDITYLLNH